MYIHSTSHDLLAPKFRWNRTRRAFWVVTSHHFVQEIGSCAGGYDCCVALWVVTSHHFVKEIGCCAGGHVASLLCITNVVNNEINNLTKKDSVIIWGGANDIARNESGKGLIHLLNFVGLCTNTNVVVVGAPKRHGY